MKTTLEERFRKKMIKIGKKNIVCRICIFPVYFIGMRIFGALTYFRNNGKRFAMLALTFLLFVVYSSFSFPMFITGNDAVLNEVSEEAMGIGLAQEAEIDMGEIVLLEDADVADPGDFEEFAHGMGIEAQYSATDILEYNQSSGATGTPWKPGLPDHSKDETGQNGTAGEDKTEVVEFSKDDWRLVLINKQHSVPDDYELILGSINTMKGSMYCDARIIEELLLMFKDAKEEGIILQICSPYRDLEYQKKLFNRKINRYMGMGLSYLEAFQLSSEVVTVPGASEHQIGLALDIVCNTYIDLDYGFSETEAGKWLAANCHKYGFILRYPLGKEEITGIEYEPWHFRYVGVEAATVIMEEEITLEEFWEEYL